VVDRILDITDETSLGLVPGCTAVLNTSGHLASRIWRIRWSLRDATEVNNFVIILHRRFRVIAKWMKIALRHPGLVVLTSPEPTRAGLTVNRVLTKSNGDVVFLSDPNQLTKATLDDLLQGRADDPDWELNSLDAGLIVENQVMRIQPDAFITRHGMVDRIGQLDESMYALQDVVDDIAGRVTRAGLSIDSTNTTDFVELEPPQPKIAELYPWQTMSTSTFEPVVTSNQYRWSKTSPKLRVIVDTRASNSFLNGTGQHLIRSIRALVNTSDLDVKVLVSNSQLDEFSLSTSLSETSVVTRVADLNPHEFDIGYLPMQATSVQQILDLRQISARVVVGHLDFIAAKNPAYFTNYSTWLSDRRATIEAISHADGIAWLTDEIAVDAARLGLDYIHIPNSCCGTVVADETRFTDDDSVLSQIPGHDFVTTLGSSYHHKARMYALRLVHRAIDLGWPGHFVLAGWDPPTGSSLHEELLYLNANPRLQHRVHHLGGISNEQRRSLVRNSRLLVQPSVQEGFGLIPFEAAFLGTGSLVADRSGAHELLPRSYRGKLSLVLSDDVELFLSSVESGPELAQELLPTASRMSEAHHADRLVNLFRKVLSYDR